MLTHIVVRVKPKLIFVNPILLNPYLREYCPISLETLHSHHTLIQEDDSLSLMGSELGCQVGVQDHIHYREVLGIVGPLVCRGRAGHNEGIGLCCIVERFWSCFVG